VLVEESGRVVLADFGVARAEGDRADSLRTQGPIGTPLYMAPEQITAGALTPQSDLYALGLMLYELVTGEVPFLEATPIATALARLQQAPPDPRAKVPLPDALAELVMSSMAIDPKHRPESAAAFEAALRAIDPSHGASVPPRPSMPVRGPESASAPMQLLRTEAFVPAPRGGTRSDTISPGERALAVLPFRYRGASEGDYLGDALTEELIDRLSTTRGLRVLSSGATERFRDDRDPQTVGKALSVDVIVDGTVQASGGKVRVSARLSDARNGRQLWSERFDGSFEDVFELQDRLGRRIAESLRVGLNTTTISGELPPDAIEHYLRARKKLRETNPRAALELLEQCLAAAPEFGPAHAAHAMAAIRVWFLPGSADRDWGSVARASVDRALACAPTLAETHLAAAMQAMHEARYADAARSTERALDIAPTYPEAHEYLGRLQCETGLTGEGLRRFRLAVDLDPDLGLSWIEIARVERLIGNREASNEAMRRAEELFPATHPPVIVTRTRFAIWDRDFDAVRRLAAAATNPIPAHEFLRLYAQVALGELSVAEARVSVEAVVRGFANARFRGVSLQLAAETMAVGKHPDGAFEYLSRAADDSLIDLVWIERCSALDPLRSDPRFPPIHQQVRKRAQGVWS
jgi:eukaryotic-like serine/threonine-protein kinase